MPTPVAELSVEQCVQALEVTNGAQRDLATERLLWMDRSDQAAAVDPLRKLYMDSRLPVARLHALVLLDELQAMTPELLVDALQDQDPGVRRQAVRIAEDYADDTPAVLDAVLRCQHDPDAHVRLQLACSLGQLETSKAAMSLAHVLRDAADSTCVEAVMSSLNPNNISEVVRAAFSSDPAGASDEWPELLARQAGALADSGTVQVVIEYIQGRMLSDQRLAGLRALEQLLLGVEARSAQKPASWSDAKFDPGTKSKLQQLVVRSRGYANDIQEELAVRSRGRSCVGRVARRDRGPHRLVRTVGPSVAPTSATGGAELRWNGLVGAASR